MVRRWPGGAPVEGLRSAGQNGSAGMIRLLVFVVSLGARAVRAILQSRADLVIENLALRQQVASLMDKRSRPVLDDIDRAFWVALRAAWPGWASRLVIVQADTVARWHRERFRRHWARISQNEVLTSLTVGGRRRKDVAEAQCAGAQSSDHRWRARLASKS